MASRPFQISLRHWFVILAALAGLFVLIRWIEDSHNRRILESLRHAALIFDRDAARAQGTPHFETYRAEADRYQRLCRLYESQIGRVPRSLTLPSKVVIVLFASFASLAVALRRETHLEVRARPHRGRYLTWLALGLVVPIALLAMCLIVPLIWPYPGLISQRRKSPAQWAILLMALAQVLHAATGLAVLRGRRLYVLAILPASITVTLVLGFFAIMTVDD